jgi:hypothetical protein
VSIFGPGFGECVIIHFGNAQWGVVDSCLDPASKRPAALEYFQAIHVDVEQSVRCIIATHWHDDHIQGISSVFEAAKRATIICTAAVATKQFKPILAAWTAMQSLPGGSGINELRKILAELKARRPDSKLPSPVLASANKTLWQRTENPAVVVKSLSPSDAAIIATTARLADFAPMASKIRRRIPDINPNDASVVLSVTVGPHKVLLGADLEVRDDPALGWKAILESELTAESGQQGFKIPHHGSPNGHSADVWTQMLTPRPWAATTPFVSGSVKLPDVEDCRRILNHTPHAYLTAPPQPSKFRDPNRTVEKTVNEVARSVHVLPGKYGHVRMRKKFASKVDEPWNFELFGSAVTMQDFVNSSK